MIVSGDFPGKDEFIRAWYLSDGSNIALVTYTAVRADAVTRGLEAAEADAMVRSIRFEH